tara:strand:+ start:1342 stop:2028 length:687 start_codon:yes stop_codon:yes gene_type:complete
VTEQLVLDLGHRSARGVEDYLVAPCNQDAVAWLDRWPDWPGPALALHGPAACGKTHLAHIWMNRSGAQLLSAGELSELALDRVMAQGHNVIVDDAGSGIDERALLHFYNMIGEAGGNLLLAGRMPPSRWMVGLADLRSRLNAAPAVAIGRPDDALIGAVLVKLFGDRQVPVDGEVLAYVLARMERSFAAARTLVAALDRAALAAHRRITIPLAREVMAALEDSNSGRE